MYPIFAHNGAPLPEKTNKQTVHALLIEITSAAPLNGDKKVISQEKGLKFFINH